MYTVLLKVGRGPEFPCGSEIPTVEAAKRVARTAMTAYPKKTPYRFRVQDSATHAVVYELRVRDLNDD